MFDPFFFLNIIIFLFGLKMNPLKFLNADESAKGAASCEATADVVCLYLESNFSGFSLLTGLRFLRALRLIQFSEILQFLNILKTR